MPTAGKMVAAVFFAGVAWVAAHLYAAEVPDGRPAGLLREIAAMIGLICGWLIMGSFLNKPRGRIEAMGTGMRTALTLTVFTLLGYAIWDMLMRAIDGRYKEPMQAVLDIFARAIALGRPILSPEVLGTLLLGGLAGGAVSHWAASRWK